MERVLAVMVSHDAPSGIAARIAAVRAQVEALVVVDNGSCQVKLQELERAVQLDGVHLIRNRNNDGLARALNQGLAWARAQGADWTLLLDHDSEPHSEMVAHMLHAARGWSRPLAVVVPSVEDAEVRVPWRWLRSHRRFLPWFGFAYAAQERAPLAVDFAIGSGMLVNTAADAQIGGMWDALFVDGIDTEYCLRARRCGFDIVAQPLAVLQHRLGQIDARRLLGVDTFPTHHAPHRQYYIARNRMLLLRRHGLRFLPWLAFECCSALKLAAEVLLYEQDKGEKLWMMLHGSWDGLLGRSGRMRG